MLIALLKNLIVIPALTLLTVNLAFTFFCTAPLPGGGPDGFDLVDWLGLAFIAVVAVVLIAAFVIDKAIESRPIARMALPRLHRMAARDRAGDVPTYRGVWLERRVDRCCRTLGVVPLVAANDNRAVSSRRRPRRPARAPRRLRA